MLSPASQANTKLHLYHNQEETIHDSVFVRIDCDLAPVSTAAPRSCAGTTAAAGITVSVSNGDSESVADARSITNTTRSDVGPYIQRAQTALDWPGLHFRARRWFRRRSYKRFALLRRGRVRRCVEDDQRRHHVDTGV